MYSYRAYGLGIESALPLPELIEQNPRRPDVIVRLDAVSDAPPPGEGDRIAGWARRDQACMVVPGVGAILIRQGREIVLDRLPDAGEDACRLFLLGPALGLILHQRGFLVLHASAMAVDCGGRAAVAFLADKGEGKSTLAAAMRARGHELLADDLVAVDMNALPAPLTYPGFPQLKLFPESVAQLGRSPDDLPRIRAEYEKRACRLADDAFAAHPLPLRRIYALETGDEEAIVPLTPREGFMNLVRHSYALAVLQDTQTLVPHFKQAMELARGVPIATLRRRRGLERLGDVVALVEADLARER